MAIFKKVVARPGTYLVRTLDGRRAKKTLTKNDFVKAAKTGNEMISDGLLVPCPYSHSDGKREVPVPLTRSPDDPNVFLDAVSGEKPRWDHAVNSGFARSFEVEKDGALVAYIEAEGEHADRLGKTFLQTSPLLLGQWVDGKGNLREMAPLHVAVTNHGVEMGQENFKLMPSDQNLSIAMSFSEDDLISMSDDDPSETSTDKAIKDESSNTTAETGNDDIANKSGPGLLNKLKSELKSKLGITLPDTVNESNLIEYLLVIVSNRDPENQESEEDFTTKPEGAKEEESPSPPIIMSLDPNSVEAKKINAGLTALTESRKGQFKARIEKAIENRRVGRAHAEKKLFPLVDAFAMSLDDINDDGTFKASALEMSLDVLEDPEILTDETKRPTNGENPSGSADMLNQPNLDLNGADENAVEQKTVDDILNEFWPQNRYPVMSN